MVGFSDVAIRADDLTRRFETVTAVDGLSLAIQRGVVFGFLGPNGAGKTTTIRLLLGVLEASSGRAEVLGHDVLRDGDAVRRVSGVLLEHTGLYERLSANDNLDYYGRLWGMTTSDRRARITELLTHFGLADRAMETVGEWSRGMKQKVALARALLHRPEVVFLDEPTAGLDPVASVALRSDLLDLARREGVTVFITTHNLDEAERICDRVGVIRGGRLVAEGTPDSLRSSAGRPALHVRGTGLERLADMVRRRSEVTGVTVTPDGLEIELNESVPAAPIVRVLVEGGADVEEVTKKAPSLEEAFLALLGEAGTAVP